MRLLLDTHIWLWSLLVPQQLPRKIAAALGNRETEIWLSPISVWEFLILAEKGRLRVDRDPHAWLREALQKAPANEAPLTHEIAMESRRVNLPHPDPADRFLAATARVLDLTLATADERLLRCKGIRLLR